MLYFCCDCMIYLRRLKSTCIAGTAGGFHLSGEDGAFPVEGIFVYVLLL